jgi:hypothetical protein
LPFQLHACLLPPFYVCVCRIHSCHFRTSPILLSVTLPSANTHPSACYFLFWLLSCFLLHYREPLHWVRCWILIRQMIWRRVLLGELEVNEVVRPWKLIESKWNGFYCSLLFLQGSMISVEPSKS